MQEAGKIGDGKSYFIITMGCQMNENDSELLAGILESLAYSAAGSIAEADLVVINSCAVRQKPEAKVAALLGRLKSLKEQNSDLLIAVGGCMTQQEEAAAYIKERFRHVDLVFGTHALSRLPQLLEQAGRSRKTLVDTGEESVAGRERLPVRRSSGFQAWVPVIYGCNNYCSYCIVPYVRGRERSRQPAGIIAEVEKLGREGYLQVTLLGQNVNSYGNDLPGDYNFARLLMELNQVESISRIRFMTSHPKDLSRPLIEAVRDGGKICEHFHLPAQSGSNRILELMNRRYTRERYLDLVREIRAAVPGVSVTTDLIVGFPGETAGDFEQTLELVEQARFDAVFAFIYSLRQGTAAASMEDLLPREEKESRLERLLAVQNEISLQNNQTLTGCTVELLVEGKSKGDPLMLSGRTRSNKLVHFPAEDDLAGRLLKVRITEARAWSLLGEKVD